MKQTKLWLTAAILVICGLTMLTSCSSKDNPATDDNDYADCTLLEMLKGLSEEERAELMKEVSK